MADITLRIAWYRLAETYKSAARSWEGLAQSYSDFSIRRVDVLDMLFIGWLLAAFAVIAVVNLYVRFAKSRARHRSLGDTAGKRGASWAGNSGETVRWVNAAIAWLGHQQRIDWVVYECLRALTDQAKHHSAGEVEVRFEKTDIARKMATSVELASVSTDSSNPDILTILGSVAMSDVSLSVAMVTSSVTSLQTASCDVRINELRGLLEVQCRVSGEVLSIRFDSPPHLNMQLSPVDSSATMDRAALEALIHSTICGFHLQLTWPPSRGAPGGGGSGGGGDGGLVKQNVSPLLATTVTQTSLQAAANTRRVPRERRLLVKMIKANGLMNKDFTGSCDPYCSVAIDDPPQQHMTSVVKNTINPFFDEHFLLNVTDDTKQLKFEVFDRNHTRTTDEFLGRAVVTLDEMRRVPSSRQIIPLTGKTTNTVSTTSGSITVELLLMEAGPEASGGTAVNTSQLYRYIETNQTVTPGGAVVTTSTVLTDRARDGLSQQPAYSESPIRVEKSETSSSYTSQNSVIASQTSNVDLNSRHVRGGGGGGVSGSDGMAELALRELTQQQQHTAQPKTTVITLIGRPKDQGLPTINTVAPSTDDLILDKNSMTASIQSSEPPKRKSFASALKKRFSRSGKRSRTQSTDRAPAPGANTPTFRDGRLLRPPTDDVSMTTSNHDDADLNSSTLSRKTRSNSLSASFRNLFQRANRKAGLAGSNGAGGAPSRESSVPPRVSPGGVSPGALPAHSAALLHDGSQPLQRRALPSADYSPQPVGAGAGPPLSTSVPAKTSPLQQ